MGDPAALAGLARYGINTDRALGITMTQLRALARRLGRDHDLAAALWRSGIHEARILATIVENPALVDETQLEAWVGEVDSWDLCDQLCGNLVDRTDLAFRKAIEWSAREEVFTKRAGFATMAWAAVHRKDVDDEAFEAFLPRIAAEAHDDRNYVKKAVSWALRQIGKRNRRLHSAAVRTARQIGRQPGRAPGWIARDALRELESPAVRDRVRSRGSGGLKERARLRER